MTQKPKYVVISTLASFLVPLLTVVWFVATYSFTNPDGTPDNAPIRSLPAVVVFSVIVFLFQLGAYTALGNALYKQSVPTIKPGLTYASGLAVPIPVLIYFLATMPGQPYPASILTAISIMASSYAFLWLSFITGAFTQLYFVKRHNKARNPDGFAAGSL